MKRPRPETVLGVLERFPRGTTCTVLARELEASYMTTRSRLGILISDGYADVTHDNGVDIWRATTILTEYAS